MTLYVYSTEQLSGELQQLDYKVHEITCELFKGVCWGTD